MNLRIISAAILVLFFSFALGLGVWTVTANHYEAKIAATEAASARALAEHQVRVIEIERLNTQIKTEMEAVYAASVQTRIKASRETARLESELAAAIGRLRDRGGSGDSGGMSATADAASACPDLRDANARLARALERLASGGGGIVRDGQQAADVAAIAAVWSRQIGGNEK